MRPLIHHTAQVHPKARLGSGVVIGPKVIIAEDVVIASYSCIGGMPEHRSFFHGEETKGVVLEPGVRVFEFVTIHGGTQHPTWLHRDSHVQNHSHIGHDSVLEECATVGGQVSLAGHTVVMENAIVAGKSCTHQFSVVGAYGILSAASYLRGHLPPGEKWFGTPGRHAGLNEIGLSRGGMTHEECLRRFSPRYEALIKGRSI